MYTTEIVKGCTSGSFLLPGKRIVQHVEAYCALNPFSPPLTLLGAWFVLICPVWHSACHHPECIGWHCPTVPQLPPLSPGLCSLGGQVGMGHVWRGICFLSGVVPITVAMPALRCSWCSVVGDALLWRCGCFLFPWQVWQIVALIVYF